MKTYDAHKLNDYKIQISLLHSTGLSTSGMTTIPSIIFYKQCKDMNNSCVLLIL